MNQRHSLSLYAPKPYFSVLFCLLCVFLATTAFAETTPSNSKIPSYEQQLKETSPLNIPDNHVYLVPANLRHLLKRYRSGEPFDLLPDVEKALKAKPHLPSLHFWAGSRKLIFASVNSGDHTYDKDIVNHFNGCLKRAKRAKTLPKLKHAGQFYEAICTGGLAGYHGLQKEYLKAGALGRDTIKMLFAFLKEQPDNHATLLAVGAYNYFSSHVGTLGKVLLRLVGLPKGNRKIGLQQLYKASETGGPMDIAGKLMLIPALSNFEDRPDEAIALAKEVTELVPYSANAHMTFSYQLLSWGHFQKAEQAIIRARQLLPQKVNALNPELRLFWHYSEVIHHTLRCLLYQDSQSYTEILAILLKTEGVPKSVPLWAGFSLAHSYRIAGLDEQAEEIYTLVMDQEGSRWISDQAERFRDEVNIRERIKIGKNHQKRLAEWLSSRPMPRYPD